MKRIASAVALGFAVAAIPVFAMGATTSPTVAKAPQLVCKATQAKGHTPKKVVPPTKLIAARIGTFTLVTNCGNIVIRTDGIKAPVTITALTTLAKAGYFNATLCHRLTTSGLYVLQCGDPTATGTGGPGFTFRDENLPKVANNNYPAGTVAMANSGPSTNGSQFFLVFADTTLAPSYTIWGTITSGLDIVKAIAAAGIKDGGVAPKKTIAIEKVILG